MLLAEVEKRLAQLGHLVTPGGFTNSAGAAELCGVAVRTLHTWGAEGKGPDFVELPGRNLYSIATVLAWVRGRKRARTDSRIAADRGKSVGLGRGAGEAASVGSRRQGKKGT